MVGKRTQGGPRIFATPAHCEEPSDAASSAVGRALKPVMCYRRSLNICCVPLRGVASRFAGTGAGS